MRFTRSIVRPPAASFAAGLTTSDLGPPDLTRALEQHEAYCGALERLGLSITRLPPHPDFPDSTFVEDAAIVTPRGAIMTRPGAPSRAGEVTSLRPALARWFPELAEITAPGTLDGGDVCDAGEHFFIGVSERTNADGARHLGAWLSARGFSSTAIDIRGIPGMLHLKTGLSWLGGRRLLATAEIAGHPALGGWEIVPVPEGEEYSANAIRVNDAVVIAGGFPAARAALATLGYTLVELDMSEYRKMDGGLSCLSLRW
jgi:dimethylargininase